MLPMFTAWPSASGAQRALGAAQIHWTRCHKETATPEDTMTKRAQTCYKHLLRQRQSTAQLKPKKAEARIVPSEPPYVPTTFHIVRNCYDFLRLLEDTKGLQKPLRILAGLCDEAIHPAHIQVGP